MKRISGEFEVSLEPLTTTITGDHTQTSRFGLRKTFHGDLKATSIGEMLAAGLDSGAGAYVAIDCVTAEIEGRNGTFILTHVGTRTKTSQELRVAIVPSSGTGELTGISGTLAIRIENKKHYYDFEYSL